MSEPTTQAEAIAILKQQAAENSTAYATLKEAEQAAQQIEGDTSQ